MPEKPGLLQFHEFQRRVLRDLDPPLSDRQLDQIERLNAQQGTELFALGRHTIAARQHVGFLRIGGTTLQVLPKIFRNDPEADLHFLLYMLEYTRHLEVRGTGLGPLMTFRDDLFEILIGLYARNLWELLRRDMKKEYIRIEENGRFLRSKLLVSQQIARNAADASRLFCRFQRFTPNCLLNQVLKSVADQLRHRSRDDRNRKLLTQVLFLLDEVEDVRVTAEDAERVHLTRLNRQYGPLVALCRLFLRRRTLTLQHGTLETFLFMFDMNRLFEEFIHRFLLRHRHALGIARLTAQGYLGKLFGAFGMRYDLLLEMQDGETLLLDTKYKTPDPDLPHRGLCQSDFYQMFAYSQSQPRKYGRIVLLFPKATCVEADYQHPLNDEMIDLAVRTVDLEALWDRDRRRLREDLLVEDLGRILTDGCQAEAVARVVSGYIPGFGR